jgi:GMP synthase (glutamine-hydrolysing)
MLEEKRAERGEDIAPSFADGGYCGAAGKMPVVIVLHQPHSTAGHVGQMLQAQGHALDIRRPRFGDPLPDTLEHHAGAVIFGGPMSANDEEDYMRVETDWIGVALREKKPYLGICLGAQMLARHLGARVYLGHEGAIEVGYHDISPIVADGTCAGLPSRVYQWHKEGFDLPAGARLLAASNGPFPNQAMAVGPSAVGLQFHPEITYAQVCRWTGNNPVRLAQPGAQPRNAQMNEHIAHGPVVRRWLDHFLAVWLKSGD